MALKAGLFLFLLKNYFKVMRKFLLVITGSLLLLLSATAQTTPKYKLLFRKGIEMKNINLFPEAMSFFKRSLSLNKNFDSVYTEIGSLYITTGKPDSAVFYLNKAFAINPKLAEPQIILGNLYRDIKSNTDSALICYLGALKVDSLNKKILYSIAWCYNAKKDYEKVFPYAIKALEIDNTYRPAYGEMAHAYRNTKKYAEAVEQFKKYFTVTPPIDLPYFYSGLCYMELNQKENAMKMHDELIKINPKMAENLKKKLDAMK